MIFIESEYITNDESRDAYEAHRQCFDIQLLIDGLEMINCCPAKLLVP